MEAVFEPFVNSGFNSSILQLDGNVEYFLDKLQIWEVGLAKTVAPSYKKLPHRLFTAAALFSSISLGSLNTFSSDTKVNLNLEFFRSIYELKVTQISKKREAN